MAWTPPDDEIVQDAKPAPYQFTPPDDEIAAPQDRTDNPYPTPKFTSVDSGTQDKLVELSRKAGISKEQENQEPLGNLQQLSKNINTPLAEVIPGVKDVVQHVKGLLTIGESPYANTSERVLSGVAKGVIEMGEAFTSPLGIATLGMGALPKAVQKALSLGFAAQMATQLPGQYKQLSEAVKSKDPGAIAETATSLGLGTAFTAFAAKHGLTRENPLGDTPEVQAYKQKFWDEQAKRTAALNAAPEIPGGARITPPEEKRNLQPPTTGGPDASTIRTDQRVIPAPGQVAQTGEATGGNDVQQKPPGQPEPVAERKEVPPVVPPQETPQPPAGNVPLTPEQKTTATTAIQTTMAGRTMDIAPADVSDPNNPHLKNLIATANRQAAVTGATQIPEGTTWQHLADAGVVKLTPKDGAVEVAPQAPSTIGGPQSALPPEAQATSQQNNSRAAFEALAKKKGTPLPTNEKPAPTIPPQETPPTKPPETPAVSTAEAEAVPKGPQKYRIGKNPSTYEIVERLPASEVEKANGEQPVKIKNDRTGEVSTVLEQDLTAVQSHAGEEKAAKGPSLDEQLRAYKLDPSVFPDKASKREAIRRAKAKADDDIQAQLPEGAQTSPIRWVGGKRQFLPLLDRIFAPFRELKARLVEPFFGSGTVRLGLQPDSALANDLNTVLMNFHRRVAAGMEYDLPYKSNAKDFARARDRFNQLLRQGDANTSEAAKLFYYLNQTGHGGLYRVNSKGEYNVPFQADKEGKPIRSLTDYRKGYGKTEFSNQSYDKLKIRKGDFIYSDPPYDTPFTAYGKEGFTWEDQVKHAEWLARQEAPVVTQNEATPRILDLYRKLGFDVFEVPARRSISRDAAGRGRESNMEMLATKNIPREQIEKAIADWQEPQFATQADPNAPPINEGAATGVEGIGALLRHAGYDEKIVAVAQRILERLDKTGALDFSKLTLQLKQQLAYGGAGLAHVSHDLIQLASGADATTFPHELFHFLFEHLPAERQSAINQYRLSELREIFGDNIPKELADGTLTTEAFLKAFPDEAQQQQLYHLINNSEFLADFSGKEAVSDYEKANDPSKWNQFKNTVRQLARIVVQAVRSALRLRPDMRQIFDELQSGKWRPDTEGGKAYDTAREAQAQAPRTLREYEKEKAFNEPLVAERTLGAYGDIADLKNKFADQLDISEQARKNLNLPSQNLLSTIASGDARLPRVAFDNYNQVRILTEHAGPGARWSVIRDAWRGATDELNRMANTEKKFQRQQDFIESKGFKDKMKRAFMRKADADMSQRMLTTYKHQITEQAGLIIKALNEKGKTDAQMEQLRSDLARVQKLGEFGEAVRQRVQDIVDTVAATEKGRDLLYNGADKTGTKIYQAYLDLKQATPEKLPGLGIESFADERFLSEADKAKVAERKAAREAVEKLPLISEDHKLFAKLAAQVLAANTDLRLQLTTMQHFNTDPDFAGKVTAVGEQFRKQYEKDPTNAVKQMVKATAGLTKKALDAQTAWLRVNADVTRELKKYQALDEATTVDRMVRESPQWNERMNLISRDAGSIEVPPSERGRDTNPISPANVWNEFMGRGTMVGPSGAAYEIDLGHTKATADAAQLEIQKYLNDINGWLNDPKNATSPYRDYWQMRFDFADASLNVSLALRPPTVESMWWKNPATIPEFFFKGASLPEAKVSSMASANYARAWVVADQWYNGAMPKIIYALRKGMGSHGKEYDPNFDIKRYQRDVLDRLASEYRNGKALAAGDRLNNGIVLTQQDIKTLETIGFHVNELMNLQRNVGREKLMPNTLVIDEWAKGAWGLRAPQELGARKGTTLPHEFSQRARTLARLVAGPQGLKAGDLAGLERLLDSQDNFTEFVQRFIAERRADYSTLTPFEDIYKDIAQKWRDGAADAPQTLQEVIDYIDANTTGDYDKDAIKGIVLGEMDGQLRKFYKDFVEPNKTTTGTTVETVQRESAFSKAYQRDVGSSFYYDYGAVTAPEIRNMGVDSTNFHLVRLVNTLDGLVKSYDTAIAQIENVAKADQKAFIKKGMAAFRSGEDFRNWERLKQERRIAQYFKESLPQAYGKDQSLPLELFSNVKRVTGDAISLALSGLGTFLNVSFGSPMKMMLTLGALDRVYGQTYFRGVLNTITSVMRYGAFGLPKTAYKIGKIGFDLHSVGLKEKAAEFWIRGLQEATEGLFRQSEFYDQQYKYGLGFANPVGERIANIIAMPYTHGMGYEARFSENPLVSGGQKLGFRVLSLAEAPLELVKSYFPQFGYVVSYDAAARTAGQIIDGMAAQARRSFDYLEKSGKLAQWDLTDIKNPKNQQIPSEYVIPGFFTKKTATAQNFAALWWSRAIDLPFHETVLNYWKKLSETKPEDRDKVSFLAADEADPAKVKQVEDARGGALMGVAVKDVHHASPENRPLELRKNQMLNFIFPLAGWFSHSARGVFQAIGKAPTDPYSTYRRLAVIAGITALNVAAMGIVGGEVEKEIKRLMYKLVYHEEFPAKQIWRGGSAKEVAQIALMDDTSFIPLAHDIAAILLGSKRGGEGLGGTVFALSKLNSILDYFKGVIKTGQPTYGVANLLKTLAPSTKSFINQLPSQQGLIAARNAQTLLDLYGPEDLRGKGQDVTFHDPTPLTPYRNDLRNAVFSGNADGVKAASKAYLDKAVAMGNTPEKAQALLRSTMSALNLMKMGGKKLTDEQLTAFMGNLTDGEKGEVNAANQNWMGAEKSLGMGGTLTAQPPSGSAMRIPSGGAGVTSAYDTGGRTGRLRTISAGGGSFRRAAIGGGTGRLRRLAGGHAPSAPTKSASMRAPKLRRTTSHFRGGTANRLRSHHKKANVYA